jgi:hypothetical protein
LAAAQPTLIYRISIASGFTEALQVQEAPAQYVVARSAEELLATE